MRHNDGAPVPLPMQRLKRISPSRYTALQSCMLREVWAASRAAPLLATGPNARLGTAIHSLFELAGKGALGEAPEATVERAWNACVRGVEAEMAESPLDRALLPLERSARDYGRRRDRAIQRAVQIARDTGFRAIETTPSTPTNDACGAPAPFERWVATPDKRIAGRIDRVIECGNETTLVDYKTGGVTEEVAGAVRIRAAYATQMRLYAAIYHARAESWPARLELWPLEGDPVTVPFDCATCDELLADAEATFERANAMIDAVNRLEAREDSLAAVAPTICRSCDYRPACSAYLRTREMQEGDEEWPWDVWGRIKEIHTLGNGRHAVDLSAVYGGARAARVRGITPDPARYPALEGAVPGDWLACFNVLPHASGTLYDETARTAIYRWQSDR